MIHRYLAQNLAKLLVLAACVSSAPISRAGIFSYDVLLDTSSQSGANGGIYFQFNGGLNPDPAFVEITDFQIGAPGGLSAIPSPIASGDVTGSLDSQPLHIANTNGNNDYLHYLVYGSNIAFTLNFTLPDIFVGDSGSALSFGLTADDGLTPVLTVDQSGFIGQISYDTVGAFSTTTLGNDAIESISSPIPEPATWALVLGALLGIALVSKVRVAWR